MKNFLVILVSLLFIGNLNAQTHPGKGPSSKTNLQLKSGAKPISADVKKANVLIIEGSTYKNLCVPANRPGGDCSSYETAWKNGYLYTCAGNDGPKLVPYHEGETFKCYSSGGIIHVEIIPAVAQAKKVTKKKGY